MVIKYPIPMSQPKVEAYNSNTIQIARPLFLRPATLVYTPSMKLEGTKEKVTGPFCTLFFLASKIVSPRVDGFGLSTKIVSPRVDGFGLSTKIVSPRVPHFFAQKKDVP